MADQLWFMTHIREVEDSPLIYTFLFAKWQQQHIKAKAKQMQMTDEQQVYQIHNLYLARVNLEKVQKRATKLLPELKKMFIQID